MPDIPPQIIVTAALVETYDDHNAASVTTLDGERIERLGLPDIAPLLRAIPSLAVASSGPAGSVAEVRIRGAEANHSLLVIDGIVANDPAAGNVARFELLGADLFQRIEVVRGPQSALWGSEAIGGVIAVGGRPKPGLSGLVEAGSFGQARLALGLAHEREGARLAAAFSARRADGIDSFSGDGERDGYASIGGRLSGAIDLAADHRLELSGFALAGRADYDGYDPLTYRRADTLDQGRNRLGAVRLGYRATGRRLTAEASLSRLGSSNRNLLDRAPVNRTDATRDRADAVVHWRADALGGAQRVSLALAAEGERLDASDTAFGGASDQRRRRAHHSATAEWQGDWAGLTAQAALRHDRFNRFADATTARLGLLARLSRHWSLAASFGQGIAQPTFFDLYGFFPQFFRGNPSLAPERSNGVEAALRFSAGAFKGAMTLYAHRLEDEIVDVYDPANGLSSTANAASTSRRRGAEWEGEWRPGGGLRVSAHAAWLDARQPDPGSGLTLREVRRPRWSGSLAADYARGPTAGGLLLAYSGARRDTDFDAWPVRAVRLAPYWLASAQVSHRIAPSAALFARAANLFDARYQDVVGYRTEGRSVHVGLRLGD